MRFAMNHITAPKVALKDFFAMTHALGATEVEIRNDLPDVLGSWAPADVKAAAAQAQARAKAIMSRESRPWTRIIRLRS